MLKSDIKALKKQLVGKFYVYSGSYKYDAMLLQVIDVYWNYNYEDVTIHYKQLTTMINDTYPIGTEYHWVFCEDDLNLCFSSELAKVLYLNTDNIVIN